MSEIKYLNKVQKYCSETECMFAFDDLFVNRIDELNFCFTVFETTERIWSLVCGCKTEEQYNLVNATFTAIMGCTLEEMVANAEKYDVEEGGCANIS